MKKIDLHIHTKSNKKGDGAKRKIKPEEFIKRMIENKISICSITNHNDFDLEEFDYINKNKEDNFIIFPGIEIDVIFSEHNETKHVILICDPDVSEEFKNVFSNDKNRNYDEFSLSYNDLLSKIKKFKHDQIIIIPHFLDKDKNRSISEVEKNKFKEDLEGYQFILEPRLITMGIINLHNELSLIGSDVKDWEEYPKNVAKLPEIKFDSIKNFSQFYELVFDSKTFIKNFINNTQKTTISLEENKKITIYNDINLIFGAKGSGKTFLIKKIASIIEKMGYIYDLVEGKDYNNNYENILKEQIEKVNILEKEDEDFLKSKLEVIFLHQEKNIKEEFYKYIAAKKDQNFSKNVSLIKKKDSKFFKTAKSDDINDFFKKTNDKIKDIFKHINNVIKIIDDYDFGSVNPEIKQYLEMLKKVIYNKEKEEISNNFSVNSTIRFINLLKSTIKKKSGKEMIPTSLKFSKLVNDRFKFLKSIDEIKKRLLSLNKIEKFKLGNLPHKGDIFNKVSITVLDEKTKCKKPFTQKTFSNNKTLINKINDFNFFKFSKINTYFTNDEKTINKTDFINEIVKKHNEIITEDGDFYEPSEGEKSILSIINKLEDRSRDFYFFDEIERGLGNEYISEIIIPKLKELRDLGKTLIISTHNANIAINTLPINSIFCNYKNKKTMSSAYYEGNMFENRLTSIDDINEILEWESIGIKHLEGGEEMFNKRKNIWKEKQ